MHSIKFGLPDTGFFFRIEFSIKIPNLFISTNLSKLHEFDKKKKFEILKDRVAKIIAVCLALKPARRSKISLRSIRKFH